MIKYYMIFINVLSFFICYIDKRHAIKKNWRIPEKMILFFSFIGGTFGFTLGMMLFHHKTKKAKFYLLEPLFCILWLYLLIKIL